MPRNDDLKNRLDELFSSVPQPKPMPETGPLPAQPPEPAGEPASATPMPTAGDETGAEPPAETDIKAEPQEPSRPKATSTASSGALVTNIFGSPITGNLLDKRVRELNCLNDIGHRIDEKPSLPEFFEWVTQRIPDAFQYPESCTAALDYKGSLYGDARAQTLPAKIVGGLRVGGELVGWLHIAYTQYQGFIDAESALLGSIVSRISSYIETHTLLERYRTSLKDIEEAQRVQTDVAAQLSTVAKISTTIASILDPDELIARVVDLTQETFSLYHAQIYLLDASEKILTLAAGSGEAGKALIQQGWKIPINRPHSLAARAVRERQGVIVNDVMLESSFMGNDLLPATRSELSIPLIVGDKLLGVLDVQSEIAGHFKSEDVSIMTALASQVAMAMNNAQQYEEVRRSERLVRSIINATPDWIYIKDRQHRYRLANSGYANALHISADDFIGKNDLELGFPIEMVRGNPEKGIRGLWADDRLVMETGEQQVYPNDPTTIDDEIRIFHTIKTPLRDENDQVWAVLAFARDVTEREQMLVEMSGQARSMAELNDMASRLNLAKSETEVLEISGRFTSRLLGINRVSVAQIDPNTNMVETTFVDQNGLLPETLTLPLAGSAFEKIHQENRLIAWPEDEEFSQYSEAPALTEMGVRGVLGAPLQVLNQVIGVLSVFRMDRAMFTSAEKSLMAQITALTSSALQIHRLLSRSSNQAQYMAQLNEMAGELNLALNDVDVMTIAGANTCRLMGVDQVSIALLDSSLETMESMFISESGLLPQKVKTLIAGTGVEKIVMENRLIVWPEEDGTWDSPEGGRLGETGVQAIMGAPLQVLGQVIGVFSVPLTSRSTFTAEEKNLMAQIAALTSSALQLHRFVDQATAQANREHILHEISTRVRTAVDADTILRTAVRELGDALGRKTFIQLGGEVSRNGR